MDYVKPLKKLKTGGRNNIVFVGRNVESEKLSGPEKFSRRIFAKIAGKLPAENVSFIQYFFNGRKYSLGEKMFGFNETEYDGAKVYRAGLFTFYRMLKKLRPAVIHITAFERFTVIAVLYRMLNRVKIVYTCNGVVKYENSELKKEPFLYRLKDSICERIIFRFSDKIVFPSANALDISKKYYKNSALKAAVIPHGIDEVFCKAVGSPAANTKTGKVINAVFLYKNVLNNSGLDFLMNFLKSDESKVILHIITKHEINTAGVNSVINVIQPMDTSELAEFYSGKDIFFSLNEYDTFSISTAEAMAAGVIPVVTNQTGVRSFIEDGANGFTVSYGDTQHLSGIINTILSMDQNKQLELKRNASAIYEKLNWDIAADSYMQHYKQLSGDLND